MTAGASAPHRRLFFALWPDEAARRALILATATFVSDCEAPAVPSRNLHVTLSFLGNVPEVRIPELRVLACGQAEGFAHDRPLSLTLDTLAHWSGPGILCVLASKESTAASALAQALRDSAVESGFHPDLKPFRAHVTVARKVSRCGEPPVLPKLVWSFDSFALIESRTEKDGPLYSVVESWPLVKTEKAGK